MEVSTVVANDCLVVDDFGTPSTRELTIQRVRNRIVFVYPTSSGELALAGSFDARTGEFSVPIEIGAPRVTGVRTGRFSSGDRFTSQTTMVLRVAGQTCTVVSNEVGQRRS